MLLGDAGSQWRNFIFSTGGSSEMNEKSYGLIPFLLVSNVSRCMRRYFWAPRRLKSGSDIRNSWLVLISLFPSLLFGWRGIFAISSGHPLIVIFCGFSTKKYLGTSSSSFLFKM